jgi:hypothetical protein
MSSILKTGDLIRSIKRRAFIPSSQETFTDEDLLSMATEEVNIGLVPLIQRMHEEHLIYYIEIELTQGRRRYPIPPRAHGNKLRDVALIDENDNVFEMHRYSLGEISDFTNTTTYINTRGFYLENNDIVLANFDVNIGNKLRIYFYMRPNHLVLESKGSIISSISEVNEINQITPINGSITNIIVGSNTTLTCVNHGLKNGDLVFISGTNTTPSIQGFHEIFVTDSNNYSISIATTSVGSVSGNYDLAIKVKKLKLKSLPVEFLDDDEFDPLEFDFIQNTSPNKILHYDIRKNSISQLSKEISFPADLIPDVVVGSYINLAEETFVPNIPTELHPILAQRVAVMCLEAMGDEQNKQSAERKLAKMEQDAGTFLDNRVEGAVQKIKSRNSPLVNTLNTLGRRNRRW